MLGPRTLFFELEYLQVWSVPGLLQWILSIALPCIARPSWQVFYASVVTSIVASSMLASQEELMTWCFAEKHVLVCKSAVQ